MNKLTSAGLAWAVAALLSVAGVAHAQSGEGPMRLVVSAAAGTAPDIIARLISAKLSESFKRAVVVDNKPGANGGIAAAEVLRAEPNGGTLLVTPAGTLTANPHLYREGAATTVTDLSPVTQIATVDFVVAVRSDLPIGTLPELIAYIKAHPGRVNASTTAHGSFPHLAAEMLKQRTGLDFTIVKNNGGAAAGSAVAGGHADFVIETSAVLEGLIQAGHLRPIASTGATRGLKTPGLPTVAEAGLGGYAISGWIALAAPKATPLATRDAIQRSVVEALNDPAIRERLEMLHFAAVATSPSDTGALIARERMQLGQVIEQAGLGVAK